MVLVVLTVAVGMLSSTMVSTARLRPIQRETALASEAARAQLETMRARPFDELFALYNADPADDPGGAGTAPGAAFAVPALDPQTGDEDGLVGVVRMPAAAAPLREDAADASLGLPRDLDADGELDGADHAGDYEILPVEIRLEWKGAAGPQDLVIYTMFADL